MNLNTSKSYITKNDILNYVSDVDIYTAYLDGQAIDFSKNMLSPLRREKSESFGFFKGRSNEICWKDFVLGTGTFVEFVRIKFGLSYFEALSKIATDFKLPDDKFFYRKMTPEIIVRKEIDRDELLKQAIKSRIGITRRDWNRDDALFWSKFGITFKTMQTYNVVPVSIIYINDKPIKADKYAYAFIEFKDGEETYKIYQPFSEHFKWLNNHDDSVWQGWSQLPERGGDLIITKSLKDVMAIRDVTGIPVTALQCENVIPKESVFEHLKSRFQDVYIFYDNDFDKETNWGRMFSKTIADKFGITQIEIPDKYKSKDFSDFVVNHGQEVARSFLKDQLFPF